MDFSIFLNPASYVSLLTLTFLEIVLGIDNIIFISILTDKLPEHQQKKGRLTGLALALIFRILLLLTLTWIIGLVKPLFSVFDIAFSGRDIILLLGGLFLMFKSTVEIHNKLESDEEKKDNRLKISFLSIVIQIGLLDIVFSLDSVITAIGLVKELLIMIIAVVISMLLMMMFSGKIGLFINKHPTLKMLALSFLLMIGVLLFLEGFHVEVPKGYIYFAMFFSFIVEMLNIKLRKKHHRLN